MYWHPADTGANTSTSAVREQPEGAEASARRDETPRPFLPEQALEPAHGESGAHPCGPCGVRVGTPCEREPEEGAVARLGSTGPAHDIDDGGMAAEEWCSTVVEGDDSGSLAAAAAIAAGDNRMVDNAGTVAS